jgi:hypothetical protein
VAKKPKKKAAAGHAVEPLDLSILGGAVERRYRHFRPELDAIPWGSLAEADLPAPLVERAREHWMGVCLNEYQSAGAIADAVSAFVYAQAPIDLTSVLSRFVLDEITHSELAARIVGELGGGPVQAFPTTATLGLPDPSLRPIVRAAYFMMRGFCTGEALSLAIMRELAKYPTHPLIMAVLQRIAKDEAAHGSFGWIFFDWAGDRFTKAERGFLKAWAQRGMDEIVTLIEGCSDDMEETLGWLPQRMMKDVMTRALEEDIRAPLLARGLC